MGSPQKTRNPFLNRMESRLIGHHGRRSEKRVARSLGRKPVPGSGSRPGVKGDIRLDRMLLETKATAKRQFVIKKAVLDKIEREALAANRMPGLMISFTSPSGEATRNGDWLLVPKYCLE